MNLEQKEKCELVAVWVSLINICALIILCGTITAYYPCKSCTCSYNVSSNNDSYNVTVTKLACDTTNMDAMLTDPPTAALKRMDVITNILKIDDPKGGMLVVQLADAITA